MLQRKNRILYEVGIGLAIAVLFKTFLFQRRHFLDDEILYVTLVTVLLLEGNIQLDHWLNQKISWIHLPVKRMFMQLLASLSFTLLVLVNVILIINYLKFGEVDVFSPKLKEVFVPTLLITFIILVVFTCLQFLKSWKTSIVELEQHKTESANAQLQNLKNQLNPHFLFNNVSVLTSLVYKNQDKAADFINELAKVYRYVLDTKNAELVPLQEELTFLNHYIYLQKIRFEDSISFEIKIEENTNSVYILPMCLQMFVENTIQHNEASQANPLQVLIYTENKSLVIENPIQPRSNVTDSTKTGLKNIEKRYSYFTDEKVTVSNNGATFKVILPLIQKK